MSDRIDDIQSDVNAEIARGEDENRFGNRNELRRPAAPRLLFGPTGTTSRRNRRRRADALATGTGADMAWPGIPGRGRHPTPKTCFGSMYANLYFSDRFYGFRGRVESDGLADEAGEIRTDSSSFGPGFRISTPTG